jgi:hypothetical protein
MNKLKLSKTSWLILAAGVFVVILAGLGLTRSQQLREQTEIDDALTITTTRLNNLETTQLDVEAAELQRQLDESMVELGEVKDRLRSTVVSVDVTDEFFRIAEYSNVQVTDYRTSSQMEENLGGVGCLMTTIGANIMGTTDDLINFVINLNNGYTTGVVRTINISIPEDTTQSVDSTITVNMAIYSYEGT